MEQNGISDETEGRIAVLGFYFSAYFLFFFIAFASVRVEQHRPTILTGRQSCQKLQ